MIGTAKAARPLKVGRLSWDMAGLWTMLLLGLAFGLGYMALNLTPVDLPWGVELSHLYSLTWGVDAASKYVYPPTVAQVITLLHWVPGAVLLWTLTLWACAWIAYREWSIPVVLAAVPAFAITGWPFVNPVLFLLLGNVQLVIAAVCVLGLRWPALWSLGILTKIAPGIGLLWFLFRREWRDLGIALGVTAALTVVSVVLSPGAWADFLSFAQRNTGTPSPVPVVPVPLALRVAMSVALLAWGAPRGYRWTVPLAVGWSAIALYEWSFLTVWAAALPVARGGSRTGDATGASAATA